MLIRAISFIGNGYYMAYAGFSVIQSIQIDVYKKYNHCLYHSLTNIKRGKSTLQQWDTLTKSKVIVDTVIIWLYNPSP